MPVILYFLPANQEGSCEAVAYGIPVVIVGELIQDQVDVIYVTPKSFDSAS